MTFRIVLKADEVRKELQKLSKKVPAELAKAINKTATASRRSIKKEIIKRTGVKGKNLQKLLPIQRADGRNPNKLFAIIRIKGRKLSLLALSKKGSIAKRGKGLKAEIAKKNFFFKGGFVARMPRGHAGIFKRKRAARLPIKELRMKANPEIVKDDKIDKAEDIKNQKLLLRLFKQNLADLSKKFSKPIRRLL